MQLDLAMKKELSHDSRIEIVSSEPCQTRPCRRFRQVSCLGRQANAKQGLVKRLLRDQKKTCPDRRRASTIGVGFKPRRHKSFRERPCRRSSV
jgi:hypothetical protein